MSTEEEPIINSANNEDRARRFGSFLNLLPSRTTLQHDRQAFRTAFVHSAAIIFVLVCGACALLAFRILEPFLRSLLWSILAGAFLFPFKYHLTSTAHDALCQLENESHLLFYGLVILLPLKTIDRTIESIGPFCLRKWKELLIILIFLPTIELLQTGVIYRWVSTIGYDFIDTLVYLVHLFDSLWVTTLVIGYIIAVLTVYKHSPLVTTLLNWLAIPVWFILLVYLSQILPVSYRLVVVILAIVLTVVGLIVDFRERIDPNSAPADDSSRRTSIFTEIANVFTRLRTSSTSTQTATSSPAASSTPYFSFLLWSLVAIKIYQLYRYLLIIPMFIIAYKVIKYLLINIYEYLIEQDTVKNMTKQITQFIEDRKEVITPSPLQGLVRFFIKGDKKFNHGLRASIDYLVSALMIITLFVTVIFASIILIIQIQHEGIQMIKLTGDIVNEAIIREPAFKHLLPDKNHMGQLMESAVNNFHSVGRTWITKQVNALSDDSISNAKLEKDVLDLWDHLYNYMSNTSNLLLPDKNRSTVLYSPANHTLLVPNFDFSLTDLYNLIRNNIGVLRTVLDSVWSNTALLVKLLSTFISLLFTGGFALLNFLVSFIVFVTVLFYLLSNSDRPIYRPIEWLNNALTVAESGLGQAVNDAVTSVFVASLKMAAFYGLYTYVLHTIVGSNLVFLPAVIACICAVTLKSYWAALPGCLDLWLVQARPLGALLLLLGQMAPVYVVDTAIYSEVKGGGHQYLTALAIAGGVYYRGIEGAIIGPIVLCCLLVGVKLYNKTMATPLSSNNGQEALTRGFFNRSFSLQTTPVE